jgi:hypothetical protein
MLILGLLTIAGAAQAQFDYVVNNGSVTITGYTGKSKAVVFPITINRLWVNAIGGQIFQNSAGKPTSVFIPANIKSISSMAFLGDDSLNAINVLPGS